MKLYFIKKGNQYLTKRSKLQLGPERNNPITLSWTFSLDEARYWDTLSSATAQLTKLRNIGYQVYLSEAKVIEDKERY